MEMAYTFQVAGNLYELHVGRARRPAFRRSWWIMRCEGKYGHFAIGMVDERDKVVDLHHESGRRSAYSSERPLG